MSTKRRCSSPSRHSNFPLVDWLLTRTFSSYQFDFFSVTLDNGGEVHVEDLHAIEIFVNGCASTSQSSVYFPSGLEVVDSLEICARQLIQIGDPVVSNGAEILLTSTAGTVVYTSTGFEGTFDLSDGGQLSTDYSGCSSSVSSGTRTGSCDSGSSTLTIVSAFATVSFSGTPAPTPTPTPTPLPTPTPTPLPTPTPTNNPTPSAPTPVSAPSPSSLFGCAVSQPDSTPSSPVVSNTWTIPAAVLDETDVNKWWVTTGWYQSNDKASSPYTWTMSSGAMTMTDTNWNSGTRFFFLKEQYIEPIYPFFTYKISFEWWPNEVANYHDENSDGLDFTVTVAVTSRYVKPSEQWMILNDYANELCGFDCNCEYAYKKDLFKGPNPPKTPTLYSTTFVSEKLLTNPMMFLRIKNPGSTNQAVLKLQNVKFERMAKARSFSDSPLVTTLAELVTVPTQPILPTPAQTDCPHLESGLLPWSSASTWGKAPPTANGAPIKIPANSKVLLLGCNVDSGGSYGTITVPSGSELIIGDVDMDLVVHNIVVEQGGKLRIGSSTCRLNARITITLDGTTAPTNFLGQKSLTSAGTLDIVSILQNRWMDK